MMKIKAGMYVKLQEVDSCGCGLCKIACENYLRVVEVDCYHNELKLEDVGKFSGDCDWLVKPVSLENK